MTVLAFWRGVNFFLVSLLLRVSVVSSRFTSTFLNDRCLKPPDYSIYPRCIIRTMVNPNISCESEMSDEIIIMEASISSVSGIIFECYADEPLNLEFDGLKALPKSVSVPVLRNLSKVEYGLYFGYKPIDRNIVGKYSFFKIGNRSLEKSFYVYFKDYPYQYSRKYKSPFLFQNPLPYQLESSENYVLPCRPYDKSANVKLFKSGIDVTKTTWTSFQPQLGFVINTTTTEKDPWGHYECISGSSKLSVILVQNGKTNNKEKTTITVAKTDNSLPWYLRWYIKGNTMNCNVKVDIPKGVRDPANRARLVNLVNIRAVNPLDSRLKIECKEDENCQGVYSKQVGHSAGCVVDETNETRSCSVVTKYYDSGLLVCSCEDKEITLEYFTGLDNQFYPHYEMQNKPEIVLRIELQVDADNNQDSIKYIGRNVTFRCTSVYYGLSIPLLWYTQDNYGEFQVYDSDTYSYIPLNEQLENVQVSEEFTMTENLTAIMCAVRIWNSTTFLNSTYAITKQKLVETPPTFAVPLERWTFYTGERAKNLHCRVMGLPPPKLEWHKNGQKIDTEDPNLSITNTLYISSLGFKVVEKSNEGNYSCTAVNTKDKSIKTFILHIEDPPNYTLTIVMSTLSIFIVCVFFVSLSVFYHKRKLMTVLTKSERDDFMYGNKYASLSSYETAFAVNHYNEEFEVAKHDMIIYRDIVLGSGEFGVVYKGMVNDEDVAIKTTKKDCEKLHVKALLAELKVLIHIGEHRHVVSLVGARTKEMWKGEVYVAMQLQSSGNLQNHLRSCQKFIALKIDGTTNEAMSDYENLKKSMIVITTKNLWKWSYQIACGMAHLSEKNVIHGDLATRNILLCDDLNAKISDFGLSRKMYEMEIYTKTSKDPIPWRWMAIEALEFMSFSTKSDVWSFGVTMWEIFSLGAVPYPGANYTVDFVEQLRKGLRLSKPKHACDKIYDVMTSCWHEDAELRASFSVLNDYLYKQIVEMPADPFSDVSYL